jgi:hypothetical protein
MVRHLIRLSGGEHVVIDENTPPNGSAFLTESPYEAPTMASISLAGYTLNPLSEMDVNAVNSATIILTNDREPKKRARISLGGAGPGRGKKLIRERGRASGVLHHDRLRLSGRCHHQTNARYLCCAGPDSSAARHLSEAPRSRG